MPVITADALIAEQDIITAIMSVLKQKLTNTLITGLAKTNPEHAIVVDFDPLQDDPTLKAPAVLIRFDHEDEYGRKIDWARGLPEIGGGIRFINYFQIRGGTPRRNSKGEAISLINEFYTKVFDAVLANFQLDGVASSNGEYVTGCSKLFLDSSSTEIFGGETEWYGRYKMRIHFFTERPG